MENQHKASASSNLFIERTSYRICSLRVKRFNLQPLSSLSFADMFKDAVSLGFLCSLNQGVTTRNEVSFSLIGKCLAKVFPSSCSRVSSIVSRVCKARTPDIPHLFHLSLSHRRFIFCVALKRKSKAFV